MTVKKAGITLPNPTQIAGANWEAPCVITGYLIAALCRMAEFRLWDNAVLMGDIREEIHWMQTSC